MAVVTYPLRTGVQDSNVTKDEDDKTVLVTNTASDVNLVVGEGDPGNFLGNYFGQTREVTFRGGSSNGSTATLVGGQDRVDINPSDANGVISRAFGTESRVKQSAGDVATIVLHRLLLEANTSTHILDTLIGAELEVFQGGGSTVTTVFGLYVPDTMQGTVTLLDVVRSEPRGGRIKTNGQYVNHANQQLAPADHPGFASGRYYMTAHTAISAVAAVADVLYWVPLFLPTRETITEIGLEVTTAAAGSIRLGIYTSRVGFPYQPIGDLFNDADPTLGEGTVDTGTTGVKTIAISRLLDPGLYWMAVHSSAAPTLNFCTVDTTRRAEIFGKTALSTAPSSNTNTSRIARSYANNLPNPASAALAPRASGNVEPAVFWRVA